MPAKATPTLASTLQGLKFPTNGRTEPLWKGPEEFDHDQGGITQSMLGDWLVDRERFRVKNILGLKTAERWSHRTGYGDMWHLCEESLAANPSKGPYAGHPWVGSLLDYCKKLCREYPLQQVEIDKWYNVCKVQFPAYATFWSKHPDVKERTPLFQEQVFDLPYELPSGRIVRLRGKWDSVDIIGKGKDSGIYLQENKTKGDVDETQLARQLTFDLQTMFYFVSLHIGRAIGKDSKLGALGARLTGPIRGVRYNVVRRPLSGGKGSIKQHEAKVIKEKRNSKGVVITPASVTPAETKEHFFNRLREDYIEADPGYWFKRWRTEVTPGDVERFKHEFLTPVLEQLCEWYEDITNGPEPFGSTNHFRMPYGIYSPLIDGGTTDLDEYLNSGSLVGLQQVERLFRELVP